MGRVDGKVALISGGARGMGAADARMLVGEGAKVVIGDVLDAEGAALAAELGDSARYVHLDVRDPQQWAAAVTEAVETFGKLNVLVNNAGTVALGPLRKFDLDEWHRVIDVNLNGTFRCSQHAARRMLAQGDGGRIINITSVHQEACSGTGSAYNATKVAIRNLTRTQAIELGPHGITVNVIAPGMIVTPMNKRAMEDPEHLAWAGAQIPTRRAGYPVDIANMAVFLASDAASYCTGSTFYVDGGWMLTRPPV